MDRQLQSALTKVPAVTLGFWVIKILATTFGETMGDTVSMSWLGETSAQTGQSGLNGYVVGTAIFGTLLAAMVWMQIRARAFHPWLYWATIIASTTAGTTLADFATRSLGIGYPGGSLLLLGLVDLVLLFLAGDLAWTMRARQIAIDAGPLLDRIGSLAGFAVTTLAAMIAVGVYGADSLRSMRFACARLLDDPRAMAQLRARPARRARQAQGSAARPSVLPVPAGQLLCVQWRSGCAVPSLGQNRKGWSRPP